MPAEGAPAGLAVHATAVAIDGCALLIAGRSGEGKSRLAAALVAASTPHRCIELVGDDRVLLVRSAGGLEARPHPRIAGFIERRGLGLVAVAWRRRAVVVGVVTLGEHAAPPAILRQNLTTLRLVDGCETARAAAVLAWWPDLDIKATHTRGQKLAPKLSNDEDWNW